MIDRFGGEKSRDRIPINVHPEVRQQLRKLLFSQGFEGVGYSEFIMRAIENAHLLRNPE